ncbi:hypothetical protein BJ170DRAFT_597731 [Xylariales sp. AK1849]|nr:hypothetical protein BJ170DRAFT_597731 [Xylariales sp. AK1849]
MRRRMWMARGSSRRSLCNFEPLSSRHASSNSASPTPDASPQPSPREILSKPTWSVRSLLPPSSNSEPSSSPSEVEEITPQTLRHLLRLSALPSPSSPSEEATLLSTLRSQLHFVRSIQSVDTTGVPPLRSIRDETAAGIRELTIGLDSLKEALEKEDVVGHNRRPRRRRERDGGKKEPVKGVEDWDVLGGASMKAGRYFVVRSGKGSTSEGPATATDRKAL